MFEAQRKNIDQRIDELTFSAYDAGWNAAVDMLKSVIEEKQKEGDSVAVAVLLYARTKMAECDE
jgi:hypothetical protein